MNESLNPNNSSSIQLLLDLCTTANLNNDNETFELANKLLEKLNNDNLLQKQVDDKFKSHKYNDKNMTFSKLENFRNLKIINNLSANATKVLFLIIQTISQDNLIEIRILTFASILNMSKPTLIKSLNELVDCGIISKMQSRTKTSGTIYMLNPVIASAGKHTHKTIYKKITQKAFLSKFEELNKNDYCVISSKGFISINENENQYLCFNSLSNTLVNNSNESDDDLFI